MLPNKTIDELNDEDLEEISDADLEISSNDSDETIKLKNEIKSKKKAKKIKEVKQEIFSFVRIIIIAVLLTWVFGFFFTNAKIPSGSMENTIKTGDRVFGYNLEYKFSKPKRGDIIIFRMPDDPSEIYIKRIIGLPGDEVTFVPSTTSTGKRDLVVAINGEKLNEPYIKAPMNYNSDMYMHFKVPENSYFCMGDNRNSSFDGRYWEHHFVPEKNIISKAVFRYWPLNKMGVVH